jgi:hypothetical protein
MLKVNYKNGDIFTVPLRSAGFCRGVVARMNGSGQVLGYFFGPILASSDLGSVEEIDPKYAVCIAMFGDLHLLHGNWRIVGQIRSDQLFDWGIPTFARDGGEGRYEEIVYDDNLQEVSARHITAVRASELRPDVLSGAGSMEKKLTKLFSTME